MARRRARREGRFLRWYRLLPLLALAATLGLCGALDAAPTTLGRTLLYPVSDVAAIEASATRHGVDPDLVCAVIKCESSWNPTATSSAGAVGLMQVMPDTARSLVEMGLVDGGTWDASNLTDPSTNIEFGCAYLGYLQGRLSSTEEIVAAYNAGIGTVRGWLDEGGVIPDDIAFAETRAYLQKVTLAYEGYRRSYPSGLTDASEQQGIVAVHLEGHGQVRAGDSHEAGVHAGRRGLLHGVPGAVGVSQRDARGRELARALLRVKARKARLAVQELVELLLGLAGNLTVQAHGALVAGHGEAVSAQAPLHVGQAVETD